jgi:F-type H+-transporting ATPase subunit delta
MSELTVASRYAKSLIDLAAEQNVVEVVKGDMDFFLKTLKENPQLTAVLGNPIISLSKKTAVLDAVFAGKVNRMSIGFINLMISKGRGEVIKSTAGEFINLYNTKQNIVKAYVTSATPLSEANKQQLIAEVQAATGSSVILHAKVDPALIGGFVLTVGDRQVDTSLAHDLKKLKKEFSQRVIQ